MIKLNTHYLDYRYELQGRLIDPIMGTIEYRGQSKKIRRKVLEVLALLLSAKGQIVPRSLFIELFWGDSAYSESSLSKTIADLRRAIEDDKQSPIIRTIPRKGYQLNQKVLEPKPEESLTWVKGQSLENKNGWHLVRRVSKTEFTETWLATCDEKNSLFRFCLKEEHLQILRHEVTLLRYLRKVMFDRADVIIVLDWQLDEPPYYLELPYISEGNLIEWSQKQGGLSQLDISKRLDLLQQVSASLAAVHAVDVVHRNLGATSVFVEQDDGDICIKIGEFGLSDLLTPQNLHVMNITVSDVTLVTDGRGCASEYLAPERIRGDAATAASDVYSLGVLIYQVLLGDFNSLPIGAWQNKLTSSSLIELISSCIDDKPDQRPTAQNISECLLKLSQVENLSSLAPNQPESSNTTKDPNATTMINPNGQQIGPFRLLDVLGEGGMGTVYLAEQRKPIQRKVAIKIIKAGMNSDQVLARFEAERQALALMNHVNVAAVYDSDKDHYGHPYFVMEYVPGVNIKAYCDQFRLTLRDRIKLFIQVCDGMLHAHQKGILHRDINPNNVMVKSQSKQNPVVKIIDFGVAKSLQSKLSSHTLHTSLGAFVGTPQYASPEQINGQAGEIDTRTDIYALGVTLYELLVGVTPYGKDELKNDSPIELLKHISKDQLPDPSRRLDSLDQETKEIIANQRCLKLSSLKKLLNAEISWIIQKCVESKPDDRYGSVLTLKDDLLRWLRDEPVQAIKTNNWYRIKKLVKRKKAVVSLCVVTSLGMLATTSFAFLALIKADHSAQEAGLAAAFQVNQFKSADPQLMGQSLTDLYVNQINTYLNNKNTSAIDNELIKNHINEFLSAVNSTTLALDFLKENFFIPSKVAIETDYDNQPLLQARLYQSLAEVYFSFGFYEEALVVQNEVIKIRSKHLSEAHPDTLYSYQVRSDIYYWLWDFSNAEKDIDKAIGGLEKIYGTYHELTIEAKRLKGGILTYAENGQEAIDHIKKTLAEVESFYGHESPEAVAFSFDLAFIYRRLGKHQKATVLFDKVIKAEAQIYGDDSPETYSSKRHAALNQLQSGNSDFDLKAIENYWQYTRETLGDNHYYTIEAKHELAIAFYEKGNYEKSKQLKYQVLHSYETTLGPENIATLNLKIDLANSHYLIEGNIERAENLVREASQLIIEQMGHDNIESVNSMTALAQIYIKQNRFNEAENILNRSLKYFDQDLYANHPTKILAESLMNTLGNPPHL